MESKWKRIGWGAVVLAFASGMAAEKTGVPFPEGYRSWQHVKSVVPGPEQKSSAVDGGKIFQFYANEPAVEGYRAGRFPNGSVIVRETMRTTDGERVALDVMRKEDGLYKQTSG